MHNIALILKLTICPHSIAIYPIFLTSHKCLYNNQLKYKNNDTLYNEPGSTWDARDNQKPPSWDWNNWLILAGRGFGKTKTGAETVKMWVDTQKYKRIALIGQTIDETKSVMVEGISGIIESYQKKDENYPKFEPSKKKITWPNGAIAQLFGADKYDKLRGAQFDLAWIDEFAKFKYPQKIYEQLMFCLRVGDLPRCIITTTPRPLEIIKNIMNNKRTAVTKGTTFDNEKNLSPSFLEYIKSQYENTEIGRQELYAELLFEEKNALWKRSIIRYKKPTSEFTRIVIGVDPAVTYNDASDETGIIIVGKCCDDTAYVLCDSSGKYHPNAWGELIVKKFHQFNADRVIAETNQGGDLVQEMIKSFDKSIPYTSVRASRGKFTRAEPVAALYEQHKIFHINPFVELENQMCQYLPNKTTKSPDRMDALVWAITELFKEDINKDIKVWI